jgi:hypothetical protein
VIFVYVGQFLVASTGLSVVGWSGSLVVVVVAAVAIVVLVVGTLLSCRSFSFLLSPSLLSLLVSKNSAGFGFGGTVESAYNRPMMVVLLVVLMVMMMVVLMVAILVAIMMVFMVWCSWWSSADNLISSNASIVDHKRSGMRCKSMLCR